MPWCTRVNRNHVTYHVIMNFCASLLCFWQQMNHVTYHVIMNSCASFSMLLVTSESCDISCDHELDLHWYVANETIHASCKVSIMWLSCDWIFSVFWKTRMGCDENLYIDCAMQTHRPCEEYHNSKQSPCATQSTWLHKVFFHSHKSLHYIVARSTAHWW